MDFNKTIFVGIFQNCCNISFSKAMRHLWGNNYWNRIRALNVKMLSKIRHCFKLLIWANPTVSRYCWILDRQIMKPSTFLVKCAIKAFCNVQKVDWNKFPFIRLCVRTKCFNIGIVCRMHWLYQNTLNEMDVQELYPIEHIATTLCSCNERTFGRCKSFLSTHSISEFNSISTWWESIIFVCWIKLLFRLDMSQCEEICERAARKI